MLHDAGILEQLDAFPKQSFDGEVFRSTRLSQDPLASSQSGGRWMPAGTAGVLYTSLSREGSLAEIAFHWSRLDPRPSKPVVLHTLAVRAHRALKLVRADLAALGISEGDYSGINLPRTQRIGAAVEFLGCDGLLAPSVRWPCDNLMLFPDRLGHDAKLEVAASVTVDWLSWAVDNGLVDAR